MAKNYKLKYVPKLNNNFESLSQFFEACESQIKNENNPVDKLKDILIYCTENTAFEKLCDIQFDSFQSFKHKIYKNLFPDHNVEFLETLLKKCKQNLNEEIHEFIFRFKSILKRIHFVFPSTITNQEFFLMRIKKIFIKNLREDSKILAISKFSSNLQEIFDFLIEHNDLNFEFHQQISHKIEKILKINRLNNKSNQNFYFQHRHRNFSHKSSFRDINRDKPSFFRNYNRKGYRKFHRIYSNSSNWENSKKYAIVLHLNIFNKPVILLIDSGSTLSIVKSSAVKFKEDILKYQKHYIMGISKDEAVSSEGSISDVLSTKLRAIDFDFSVIRDQDINLEADGIIGTDILKNCLIDLKNMKLTFENNFSLPIIQFDKDNKNNINNIYKIDYFSPTLAHERCYQIKDAQERYKILIKQTNLSHLSNANQNDIKRLIYNYSQSFFIENDTLKACNLFEHTINLKHKEPIYERQFPLPEAMKTEMDKHIDYMLRSEIISPINFSSYNSPCFLVKKKNNSFRFVVDMRKINKAVIPNKYSHANPQEILSRMHNAKYFTKFDLKLGFHQQSLNPNSRHILAFTHRGKRYAYNRLCMGLTDSAASFSQMVILALDEYINKFVEVYIDDCIIYSSNLSDHMKQVELVIKKLAAHNLTIEISKSEFCKESVDFLGFHLSHNKISPSQKNIDAINKIKYPNTVRKLQRVLGAFNFVRCFIPKYAEKTKILTNLLKKNSKFVFNEQCKKAVEDLKKIISSKPVLSPPDFNRPFIIETDASNIAIGGALVQYDKFSNKHVVYYHSRTLNEREQRMSTFEREFLGIVECSTKVFYKYILNSKFIIRTDHKPILHYMNSNMDTGTSKTIRGRIKLHSMNFKLVYVEGKKHKLGDFLSRIQEIPENSVIVGDTETKIDKIAPKIAIIKPTGTIYRVTRSDTKKSIASYEKQYENFLKIESDRTSHKDSKICKFINSDLNLNPKNHLNLFLTTKMSENLDSETKKIFNSVSHTENIFKIKSNLFVIYKNDYNQITVPENLFIKLNELKFYLRENKIHNKTIHIHYFEDKNLNSFELQTMIDYIFQKDSFLFLIVKKKVEHIYDDDQIYEIIKRHHEGKIGGHAGINKTMTRIQNFYKFENMRSRIQNFIKSCRNCQLNKVTKKSPNIQKVTSTPQNRLDMVAIDIVGPLPLSSKNNRYILTICDMLTRHLAAIAIPDCNANTIAEALVEKYFLVYSCAKILLSDNAKYFTGEVMQEICKIFEIKKFYSTIYYPQGNSVLERSHQELKKYIRAFLKPFETDKWDDLLPYAVFHFNTHTNVTTYSPHELTYGMTPNFPDEDKVNIISDSYDYDSYISKLKNSLKTLHNRTREITNKLKIQRIERLNQKAKEFPLKVGQKVKIINRFQGEGSKLLNKYHGPFIIKAINSDEYVTVNIKGKDTKINKNNLYLYHTENEDSDEEN